MKLKKWLLSGAAAVMFTAGAHSPSAAETIVVWHDLGDNGIKWFDELNALYQAENADITIESVSFPTDQWFGKVIAAINTDSAPDLIYNNYERVIRIQNQTDKVMDLAGVFAGVDDKAFLSDADLQVATYQDRMIILPVQRVQMGFGVRTSWLEAVDESFPETWSDLLRVSDKFKTMDPDGNGQDDTFGVAIEAANPRDLIHMLDLYTFGTGLRHTLIDPDGQIVINQPRHAEVLTEVMKLFTEYESVAPDSINHSFAEMYQVIEGGRAGMFRVGDWNVRKWDSEALEGDFTIGQWPAFADGDANAVVIGGMRGVAVPENSPNKEAAIDFAKFMLTKDAQSASLNNVGSAVRGDFPMEDLSANRLFFAKPDHNLSAYDFPESINPAYPEIEAEYHARLLDAMTNPPADWATYIEALAADLQQLADEKS